MLHLELSYFEKRTSIYKQEIKDIELMLQSDKKCVDNNYEQS